MKVFAVWIRRSPVVAFYVICYVISWGLWLPLILSRNDLAELIAVIGLFGPALACVIVSRISSSPAKDSRPIPFWLSFIAGWIVSTLAFVVFNDEASSPVVWVVFGVLALVPAYIIASVTYRLSGLRSSRSVARPKGWWVWYIVAVVLPLGLRLISVWLSRLIGWDLESDPQLPSRQIELAGSVLVVFLYTMIWAGGLNEEAGWTGLALPRLQAKFSPLVSTLIVWALWMLWHVPMYLSGHFNLSAHVLIGSFFGRFLMTWLFIRSSGGVLTGILLHTSVNVTSQFVPLTNASMLVDAVVALLVIVGGRMWQLLPKEHPAVHAEDPLAA
ncbi:MAG: CPBP family intramembrane metalloprotease [Anaerolineales bacterium]|nr:MAG: CPBP family intramembrane metalloprotease [Anaerolineales bacterium]